MKQSNNPVEVLIANIKADQQLLAEKTKIFEEAKEEQRNITLRIKEYRKDVSTMWKYMSEEQQAIIESLGLDASESSNAGRGGLNPVSQLALDLLVKAKGNAMTNGEIYQAYIDSVPKDADALTYTEFNIKLRQMFNSGHFTKKQIDPEKPNRDDIITLNLDSSQN